MAIRTTHAWLAALAITATAFAFAESPWPALALIAGALFALKVTFSNLVRLGRESQPASPSSATQPDPRATQAARPVPINQIPQWLIERRQAAQEAKAAGADSTFPDWYFDPVTERQRDRLVEMGVAVASDMLKGHASELIGLRERSADWVEDQLKFHKAWKSTLSSTEALEMLRLIKADPACEERWQKRPPKLAAKVFVTVEGIKLARGTSHTEAIRAIEQYVGDDDDRAERWEALEGVVEDLEDTETRRDYEIRKPSAAQLIAATQAVLADQDSIEIDTVADKLKVMYPQLELVSS